MKNFFKISLFSLLLACLFLAATIPALNYCLKNEEVRNYLLHQLASSLHGNIQTEKITVALDTRGLNISSNKLKGTLLNNSLNFSLPDLTMQVSYRELLTGSFFPHTLLADSPFINYNPQSASTISTSAADLNWSDEFNSLLKKLLGNRARITVTDATLVLSSTTLSKLNIQTNPDDPSAVLTLRTNILYRKSVIPLSIRGKCRNQSESCFSYDFEVQASSIPLNIISPSPDFFFSGGTADFSGVLGSSGSSISLQGNVHINNLAMTVGWTSEDKTRHQEKKYQLPHCSLDLQGSLQKRTVGFPLLTLQADTFKLQSSFILDYTDFTNPYVKLRLNSDEMELATLKKLLPDPLINDWTTHTIFPRLENGTARITDFVLAGTFTEIGNMNEPEHAHCLSWAGVLNNVDTFYNDHKPLARVHSAQLSMDGDVLKIEELSGESGESTVTRGNLSISGLYDSTLTLSTDVQGSFSLSWLNILVKAGLTGVEMQQILSPVSSLSGQAEGNLTLNMDISADDVILKSLGGKGTIGSLEMTLDNFIVPLRMKSADFTLDFPHKSVVKGKGVLGKSSFNGVLNMSGIDWDREFKLNVNADLKELRKKLSHYTAISTLAPCIATLPLKTTVTLEKNTVSANGSLNIAKSVFDDSNALCKQHIEHNQIITAQYNGTYNGKKLNISELSLHTKDGLLQASGVYTLDRKTQPTIKNLKVKATDFPVQSLDVLFPGQARWLSGILHTELKATEILLESPWSSLTGILNLTGWQGSFPYPEITVQNLNVKASLNQGSITLKGSDIRLADFNPEYPLTFQADLDYTNIWNGTVRLYGDYLDLTTSSSMFMEGKTILSEKLPIGKIHLVAKAGHMRYRNLIFSPLLVQCYFTADKIIISKALLQLDNDFIWLTGSLDNNEVTYQTYFTIQGKPVDTMLAIMGFENDTLTGSLDMKGKLKAIVSSSDKTVFETAKGPIYVEVKDGTIKSSSTFIKIMELISLENIVSKKDILEWKDNYKFNLIQGRFDLNQGVFTTDSLVMDASAFDIFSEGKIDMVDDTLHMKVKLAPFDTFNKMFSSIPYLGYVLTGKSRSLFDYTFSVTGKIKNPKVEYIPLAGTVESLTGYIHRLVSARKEVTKEVNNQLKEDMARKNAFIKLVNNELAQLQ